MLQHFGDYHYRQNGSQFVISFDGRSEMDALLNRGMVIAVFEFTSKKNETQRRRRMPIMKRLEDLFDDAKIAYEVYNHPLAYTTQEIAEKQHFSGDEMVKVVIFVVDGIWPWRSLWRVRKCTCPPSRRVCPTCVPPQVVLCRAQSRGLACFK